MDTGFTLEELFERGQVLLNKENGEFMIVIDHPTDESRVRIETGNLNRGAVEVREFSRKELLSAIANEYRFVHNKEGNA